MSSLEWWNVSDGAKVCDVSEKTIRRWIHNQWLIAYQDGPGKPWRFTLRSLMDAELVARLAKQRRLKPPVDLT